MEKISSTEIGRSVQGETSIEGDKRYRVGKSMMGYRTKGWNRRKWRSGNIYRSRITEGLGGRTIEAVGEISKSSIRRGKRGTR